MLQYTVILNMILEINNNNNNNNNNKLRNNKKTHVIIQSKHSCLLDFSLRIWKLKYIKQYCQLSYMDVKYGLLH